MPINSSFNYPPEVIVEKITVQETINHEPEFVGNDFDASSEEEHVMSMMRTVSIESTESQPEHIDNNNQIDLDKNQTSYFQKGYKNPLNMDKMSVELRNILDQIDLKPLCG